MPARRACRRCTRATGASTAPGAAPVLPALPRTLARPSSLLIARSRHPRRSLLAPRCSVSFKWSSTPSPTAWARWSGTRSRGCGGRGWARVARLGQGPRGGVTSGARPRGAAHGLSGQGGGQRSRALLAPHPRPPRPPVSQAAQPPFGSAAPFGGARPAASGNASTLVYDHDGDTPAGGGHPAAGAAADADAGADAGGGRLATPGAIPQGPLRPGGGANGFTTPTQRLRGPRLLQTPPRGAGGEGGRTPGEGPRTPASALSIGSVAAAGYEAGEAAASGGADAGPPSPVRWRSNPSARLSFDGAARGAAAEEPGKEAQEEQQAAQGPQEAPQGGSKQRQPGGAGADGDGADGNGAAAREQLVAERGRRAALEQTLSRVLEEHRQATERWGSELGLVPVAGKRARLRGGGRCLQAA
jgi:hypothetical protein